MLYLVSMSRPNFGIDLMAVQNAMAPAHSFYRFADTSWVICTPENAEMWRERLSEFVSPGGALFICRMNKIDFSGLMSQEFWNWLNAHNNANY